MSSKEVALSMLKQTAFKNRIKKDHPDQKQGDLKNMLILLQVFFDILFHNSGVFFFVFADHFDLQLISLSDI